MKLSIGIVGLPNVGKSTLFKLLTKQEVHIANYPFATIDPNVGVVPVPDERLGKLAAMSRSRKIIPAVVEFYDIAGLVKGAYKGEGLGNQFLAHIRETQAIVLVVRIFGNSEILHVEQTVNPMRDIDIVNTELALKDLETVEKRLTSVESDARAGKKDALEERDALREAKLRLERGELLASSGKIHSNILKNVGMKNLNLLTLKRQIYLLNGGTENATKELIKKIESLGAEYVVADLAALEQVQEHAQEQIQELIRKAYAVLGLISFFTTGEDETRAWTVTHGVRAPEAAGVIHSDFEKNFIRAEVASYAKLVEAAHSTGSGQSPWAIAKQKGLIRLEGKDYVVQDGDVIVVRHG